MKIICLKTFPSQDNNILFSHARLTHTSTTLIMIVSVYYTQMTTLIQAYIFILRKWYRY